MSNQIRFLVIVCVFVLSTIFFWSAIRNVLYPLQAQVAGVANILIADKQIKCNPQGYCPVDIYVSTQPGSGVAGVSGMASYSPNLEPIGSAMSDACTQSTAGLESRLQFTVDAAKKEFSLAFVALKKNAELQSGNRCITSVLFKKIDAPAGATDTAATVTLKGNDSWNVGGSQTLSAQVDTQPVTITFDASAPISTLTPVPPDPAVTGPVISGPVPPVGGACPSNGDCDCNGTLDVSDWEKLRAWYNAESQVACDPNQNGQPDAEDFTIIDTALQKAVN